MRECAFRGNTFCPQVLAAMEAHPGAARLRVVQTGVFPRYENIAKARMHGSGVWGLRACLRGPGGCVPRLTR
jgi:hypothetical protein